MKLSTIPLRLQGFLLGLVGVAIFFSFVAAGLPEQGKIAGFSFFGIAVGVKIRWKDHAQPWFWLTIGFITTMHVAIIALVPWQSERNPGIVFSPLAILDIFITMGLLGVARSLAR